MPAEAIFNWVTFEMYAYITGVQRTYKACLYEAQEN